MILSVFLFRPMLCYGMKISDRLMEQNLPFYSSLSIIRSYESYWLLPSTCSGDSVKW